jgi:glycosyltransferase involved in cell wall biosynthesis
MLIVHVLDPFSGGLATFLKLLTEELNDDYHIIVHGERADFASIKDVRQIFVRKNIRFIHWKSVQRELRVINDLKAFFELKKTLKRFKYADVVHLHSSKAGFLGRIACWQLGFKKVIYTPNGAPFLRRDVSHGKARFYGYLEKIACLFGGKVICSSISEQEEYIKLGIKADYINNGTKISAESFIVDKNYNKFRIVTSGRIADQKNPAFFNEIALAFVNLKHFEFVWIGDGEEAPLLTAGNIRVTGWLSSKGVREEVARADIYMSTSFFEGLPFAAIEAMALQKCLLLSNCTGNKDLVKEGVNGETFENKSEAINHIIYFYFNKEIMESMGLNSLEICRDYFNIQETALRYRMEYQKLNGIAINESFIDKLRVKKELAPVY